MKSGQKEKLYILTLSTSKEQPSAFVCLTEEDAEVKRTNYVLWADPPSDPMASTKYQIDDEYRILRNGLRGVIAFGHDKEKLLQAYAEAVLPDELLARLNQPSDEEVAPEENEVIPEEDLADWPVQPEEFDECTEEVEIPQDPTLEQEEFLTEPFLPENDPDGFDPYSPWDDEDAPRPSGNLASVNLSFAEKDPLASFVRQEVSNRLEYLFGINPTAEPEFVKLCVDTICNESDSLLNYDLIDQLLEEIVFGHQEASPTNPVARSVVDQKALLDAEFEFPKSGKATVYTDGSCLNNPGPGGWGVIIRCGGKKKEMSGGEPSTTNNRMEMMGVIEALKFLTPAHDISVYSDSQYVVNAINKGWAVHWRRNGWIKGDGAEAKNPDLWQELLELIAARRVQFYWVKGHNGNPDNERCDRLAQEQSARYEWKSLR